MRKAVTLSILIIITLSVSAQGWKNFRKTLKKEFDGLTPYSIPDINYSPGAVLLIYDHNEQLYAMRENAFPTLELRPKSPIPPMQIAKVSQISFSANAESNLIPNNLALVASAGFDQTTTFTMEMEQAEKHQIEIGSVELYLENLDITNIKDKLLLQKLVEDNCIIVTQALYVTGMAFSFTRGTKLDADVKADIQAAATSANVGINFVGDYKFTLSSDTSLYYAFDVYRKNSKDMKRLYKNKLQAEELKKKKDANTALLTLLEGRSEYAERLTLYKSFIENDIKAYEERKADTAFYDPNISGMTVMSYKAGYEKKIVELKVKYQQIDYELDEISEELEQEPILLEENKAIGTKLMEIEAEEYELFIPETGFSDLELLYEYEPLPD